jgi:hypothetical protein
VTCDVLVVEDLAVTIQGVLDSVSSEGVTHRIFRHTEFDKYARSNQPPKYLTLFDIRDGDNSSAGPDLAIAKQSGLYGSEWKQSLFSFATVYDDSDIRAFSPDPSFVPTFNKNYPTLCSRRLLGLAASDRFLFATTAVYFELRAGDSEFVHLQIPAGDVEFFRWPARALDAATLAILDDTSGGWFSASVNLRAKSEENLRLEDPMYLPEAPRNES